MPHPRIDTIRETRKAIRRHRDQKGDDRCWLDDYFVWAMIPGSPQDPTTLPTFEDGMVACRKFFDYRRSDTADTIPSDANQDATTWDDDLTAMDDTRLQQTLDVLHAAIQRHRDIQDRERTLDDDRILYAVLPEKLPADFRLPDQETFLGEKQNHVGCPAFWRSHQSCPCAEHNLHAWGPCCQSKPVSET